MKPILLCLCIGLLSSGALAQENPPTIEDQLRLTLDSMRVAHNRAVDDIRVLRRDLRYLKYGVMVAAAAFGVDQFITARDIHDANDRPKSAELETKEFTHYCFAVVAVAVFVITGASELFVPSSQ